MERLASHFPDKNFTTEAYWIVLPLSNAQLYTIQLEEGIYAKETFFLHNFRNFTGFCYMFDL